MSDSRHYTIQVDLTPCQIEIIQLLARGYNEATIAKMLNKSCRAINSHIMRAAEIVQDAGWILECERRRNVSAALVGYYMHTGGVDNG